MTRLLLGHDCAGKGEVAETSAAAKRLRDSRGWRGFKNINSKQKNGALREERPKHF
jgi:hypothetical protein